MHAIHTAHKLNHAATKSALIGKSMQIVVGGSQYKGTCVDVVESEFSDRDPLVKVTGCDDYSREWKVVE